MRASGNGKSVRVFGVPTRKIFDFSCGVDWRITASKAPTRGPRGKIADFLVGQLGGARTFKYANPLQGCLFLVLHPNESVRSKTKGEERPARILRENVLLPRGTRGKTNSTIKARSRGLLRACFDFEFSVIVKGTKNFAALSRRLALALHPARQNVINVPLQRGGVGV